MRKNNSSILARTAKLVSTTLLLASAYGSTAYAQGISATPSELILQGLPLRAGDGYAAIDIIAISFALLAAALLMWVHTIRRRAVVPAPSGLAMASATPHVQPSATNVDQLIQRIRTAERPDADGLYLNGSKLLSSPDKSRRLVGVVALETVALGPDLPLAASAIDQLANHMQERFRHSHDGEECRVTAEALLKAGLKGRRCDRTLTFSAPKSEQENGTSSSSSVEGKDSPKWRLIGAVKRSRYIGGRIENETLNASAGEVGAVWCSGTTLVNCTIADDAFGTSCVLEHCHILRFNPERPLINGFVHCNFSGCMISPAVFLEDLRDQGCWYDPNDPPQGDQPVKWTAFLHADDPGEQSSWKALLESENTTQH